MWILNVLLKFVELICLYINIVGLQSIVSCYTEYCKSYDSAVSILGVFIYLYSTQHHNYIFA